MKTTRYHCIECGHETPEVKPRDPEKTPPDCPECGCNSEWVEIGKVVKIETTDQDGNVETTDYEEGIW